MGEPPLNNGMGLHGTLNARQPYKASSCSITKKWLQKWNPLYWKLLRNVIWGSLFDSQNAFQINVAVWHNRKIIPDFIIIHLALTVCSRHDSWSLHAVDVSPWVHNNRNLDLTAEIQTGLGKSGPLHMELEFKVMGSVVKLNFRSYCICPAQWAPNV